MSKGRVKEYDLKRGYGTIVDHETGRHLTVYANYIKLEKGGAIKDSQEVEYEIESSRHGDWAVNVRSTKEVIQ